MAWERCPGASCSLPAACQFRPSYFWDCVPSLEKQTVALTVIPNKTPRFCRLNHVFQKSCPTGGLDARCWGWNCWEEGGPSCARCQSGNFHCIPRWLHLWPRKPILPPKRRPWLVKCMPLPKACAITPEQSFLLQQSTTIASNNLVLLDTTWYPERKDFHFCWLDRHHEKGLIHLTCLIQLCVSWFLC